MARLEGSSNHRLEFFNIYVQLHEINVPSTRSYVSTPKKLANIKVIINPKSNNNKCFFYSTGLSVYYDEIDKINPSRVSKKLLKSCERLNIDNINFPTTIKDIQQFQKHNSDISIGNLNMVVFIRQKKTIRVMKILRRYSN